MTADLADAVTPHWQKGLAEHTHLVHMMLAEMLQKHLQLAAALHNFVGNILLERVVGLCCSDETNTQTLGYPLAGHKEVHMQMMAESFVQKNCHLGLMTLQAAHIQELHIVADQMLEPDWRCYVHSVVAADRNSDHNLEVAERNSDHNLVAAERNPDRNLVAAEHNPEMSDCSRQDLGELTPLVVVVHNNCIHCYPEVAEMVPGLTDPNLLPGPDSYHSMR